MPIELPFVLPIVLPIELPIVWPRVLGRAGLVFNTLKNHDSDKDVNIILLRHTTVIRMLI